MEKSKHVKLEFNNQRARQNVYTLNTLAIIVSKPREFYSNLLRIMLSGCMDDNICLEIDVGRRNGGGGGRKGEGGRRGSGTR